MKDGDFILDMLQKGTVAGEKVKTEFSHLSSEQLNWKPSRESWSIAQCLDHLVISDCSYFPIFKKITSHQFEMNFWENWSPFGGLFGKILATQVNENPRKKLKSPKIFIPEHSHIDAGILERFHKHLDSLLEYIAGCSYLDLDKTHITSPVSKFITYSLRNCITLLIQHEHRHINQAIKVKAAKEFPGG
ncbi:MAG: DinB family protein [Bacteroidota bacterium]